MENLLADPIRSAFGLVALGVAGVAAAKELRVAGQKKKAAKCTRCKGSGISAPCTVCGGVGFAKMPDRTGLGSIAEWRSPANKCQACGGSQGTLCTDCSGSGFVFK
eukprot:tig00021037_g17460.t1